MPETLDNLHIDNTQVHGDVLKYRVRMVARDGRASAWSNPVQIQVGDCTSPPDPSNFKVFNGYAHCLLSWDFPNDPTYSYTEVWRKTVVNGTIAFRDGGYVTSLAKTGYRLVGTFRAEETAIPGDYGAEYYFKIRHVDRSGNKSNFSAPKRGMPRQLKPKDFDQTPGFPKVVLTTITEPDGIPTTSLIYYVDNPDPNKPPIPKTVSEVLTGIIVDQGTLEKANLDTKNQLGILDNARIALEKSIGDQFTNIKNQMDTDRKAEETVHAELMRSDIELAQKIYDNTANDNLNKKLLDAIDLTVKAQAVNQSDTDKAVKSLNAAIKNINDQDVVRDQIITATKTALDNNKIADDKRQAALDALDKFNRETTLPALERQDLLNDAFKKVDAANAGKDAELSNLIIQLQTAAKINENGDSVRQKTLESLQTQLNLNALDDAQRQKLVEAAITASNSNNLELGNQKRLIGGIQGVLDQSKLTGEARDKLIEELKTAINLNGAGDKNRDDAILKLQGELASNKLSDNERTAKLAALERAQNLNDLNDQEREKLIKSLNDAHASIVNDITKLKQYDNGLHDAIQGVIDSHPITKTAFDEAMALKLDKSALDPIIRQTLTSPDFKTAVDNAFKEKFGTGIATAATTQTAISNTVKQLGTPAILELAKQLDKDPDAMNFWQNVSTAVKATAENDKLLKDLYKTNPVAKAAFDAEMAKKQKEIDALGAAQISDQEQFKNLLAADKEFKAAIGKCITTQGLTDALNTAAANQKKKDDLQDKALQDHDTKISTINNQISAINTKLQKAISWINVNPGFGTMDINKMTIANSDGMKTVDITIDVNSGGLVAAIAPEFILRDGVAVKDVSAVIINK